MPISKLMRNLYPDHFKHFVYMLDRARGGCETSFSRTNSDLLEFVEMIGAYPSDMKKPTVGRKDHSLGYVSGNFEWQSQSSNTQEMALRNKTGGAKDGSKISKALKGKPTHPQLQETRDKIGNANRGRSHTEQEKERMKGERGPSMPYLEPELKADYLRMIALKAWQSRKS